MFGSGGTHQGLDLNSLEGRGGKSKGTGEQNFLFSLVFVFLISLLALLYPEHFASEQCLGLFHLQILFEAVQALFLTLIRKKLVYVYEVEQWYMSALECVTDEVRCFQGSGQ